MTERSRNNVSVVIERFQLAALELGTTASGVCLQECGGFELEITYQLSFILTFL